VIEALLAFWDGAFGSAYAVWSATLVRATPLLLVGLAVAVAFRAGVINIGAEGQFALGAVGATVAALVFSDAPRVVVIAAMIGAGAGGGAAWAAIAAWLRRRFGVLEVISTIMLNFVAAALVSWIVRGPLQEPTHVYPMTVTFTAPARWPLLFDGQRLHLGFVVGVLAVAGWWFVLQRTALGFRVRAVGASPSAAESAGGIDAKQLAFRVLVVSGACAGIAGASEVGGVTWALYEGLSPGYGYTAIAVALLARLDPRFLVPSALLFGALESGGAAMQREAGVPFVVVQVIVALVLVGVLTLARWSEVRRGQALSVSAD
jgi:general nucleoside transport system permease protein